MIKRFSVFIFLVLSAIICCSSLRALANNNLEISNNYFSFTMPSDIKNLCNITQKDNGIFVCEKISENSGLGGFAFGIKIFKSPQDYADIPGNKKMGELTAKNGTLYDMVIMRPTEIQYGKDKKAEKNYKRIYAFGENLEIKGLNGSKYVKNQGMKGEDLYNEILAKYKNAISKQWSSAEYERKNMGYMYYLLSQQNKNLLNKIGYTYYDINSDGIDELIIGEITTGKSKGIIYDLYTMKNRKPVHVLSGGATDRYFICNDVFLCNEYSPSKKESITNVFVLESNSKELSPQIKFVYNEGKNKKNQWFISYGNSTKPENVSEKLFKERKRTFDRYKRFNFTPIGNFER